MRLSQRYADHSAEWASFLSYLTDETGGPNAIATRLLVTAAEIISITNLRVAFEAAYNAYRNPLTHGQETIRLMRAADEDMLTVILPLRQRLKHSQLLQPADFGPLGINEDKTTRTPSQLPTEVPTATWLESTRLNILFEASQQSPDGTNQLRVPIRGYRVARQMTTLAAGVTPTEADFHDIDASTHSRFLLTFTVAELGMIVWIRIAYVNNVGQGPWSIPVKATII